MGKLSQCNQAMKNPTKHSVDWLQTLVGAVVGFIVGILHLLITKLLEK